MESTQTKKDFRIEEFDFKDKGKELLGKESKGRDWPVVYLIHNDKELYIGETSNMYNRFTQHLKNSERKLLKRIDIIFDDEFNKSAILDIEQSLIHYCSVDKKLALQNKNGGQSDKHNYYQREKYINKLDLIWDELKKRNLVKMDLDDIRNTDLFKYSPYNTLTFEQSEVCKNIIYDIIDTLSKNKTGTSIITGGAGTGKTIVLINMIYKLININNIEMDFTLDDDDLNENTQMIHDLHKFIKNYNHELLIGYIVPMKSIRKTLKTVFKETGNGLQAKMVIGPYEVTQKDYDIVFVDEAHRLAHRKSMSNYGGLDTNTKKLGLDKYNTTQLDIIMHRTKYRVLVYDKNQTVRESDLVDEEYEKALKINNDHTDYYNLQTQMRCKGGDAYTDYLTNIFNCKQKEFLEIEDYDFKIFDDVNDMVEAIKKLDKQYGLCRNAAGFSWEWVSKEIKPNTYKEIIRQHKEDIQIGKYKYVWNMKTEQFILSDNAVNEIGCIHTLQGYDLNYVGVILGYEIDYNFEKNKIEIDLKKYKDKYGKNYECIINAYKVIMSRGIRGCYVYACNENMQKYLKQFIKLKNKGK